LKKKKLLRVAGTSEAKTSVNGQAACLLAIGEDQKSKLSEVTFSFNEYQVW